MADLVWTREKPTQPGWYWYARWDDHRDASIVLVVEHNFKLYVIHREWLFNKRVSKMEVGEWSSQPLAEPREE